MTAGHQRRSGRYALGFDIEICEAESLGRQLIQPWRRGSPEHSASIRTELAPSEIVNQHQNDIRPVRLCRSYNICKGDRSRKYDDVPKNIARVQHFCTSSLGFSDLQICVTPGA